MSIYRLLHFLSFVVYVNCMSFTLVLPTNNVDVLKDALENVSNPDSINYRNYWSLDKLRDISKSDKDIREPIIDWLNFNNIPFIDNSDSFRCFGNVTNIFDIFKLKNGHIVFPSVFHNRVMFVEGLKKNNFTKIKPKKSKVSNSVDSRYAGLEVLERVYNFSTSSVNGSVASIEYQGNSGFNQSDLCASAILNNLKCDNVTKIIGENVYPDTETELDMQMEQLVAPNSDIWFWDDTAWLLSFATNFSNTKDIPKVISMSWGWSEDSQCNITSCGNLTSQDYVERVGQEYVKMGLRGVSILVSSGDAGAPGRTNEECAEDRPVNPVLPGGSEYITSVSATFIALDNKTVNWKSPLCKNDGCITGIKEYPTNFNDTQWTTGGGFSIYVNETPKWQKSAVNGYFSSGVKLPNKFNRNGRGYPDVSMVGHNCPVIIGGSLEAVDGTSCSSPLFAGVVAKLNDLERKKGKETLGFLNPLLYKMSLEDSSIFNDVVEGNNYCTEYNCCPTRKDKGSDFGYIATKGWDPVTGLGTPNVDKMIEFLDRKN